MANGAGPSTNTGGVRPDALGAQGAKIGRTIRSFDDACVHLSPVSSFLSSTHIFFPHRQRLDLQNERLPEFNPDIAPTMFSGPSMRRGSADSGMELLIKKTLEEEEEGGVVERIADKIARGRRIAERPSALRRHGTA